MFLYLTEERDPIKTKKTTSMTTRMKTRTV